METKDLLGILNVYILHFSFPKISFMISEPQNYSAICKMSGYAFFLFQPMLMCLKIPHMATLLRHLNVKLSSTIPS